MKWLENLLKKEVEIKLDVKKHVNDILKQNMLIMKESILNNK